MSPDDTQALIAVLVPALLGILRIFAPKIPKVALPFLAPVVGAGLDIADHAILQGGVGGASPLVGAIYGILGIGLREMLDQGLKATGIRATQSKPPVVLLALCSAALLTQGCTGLRNPFSTPYDAEAHQGQILTAGDLGAAVALGVLLARPEDADKARLASQGARFLLVGGATLDQIRDILVAEFPEQQRPVIVAALQRIEARTQGGVLTPDTLAYQQILAFLDACDGVLGVAPASLAVPIPARA